VEVEGRSDCAHDQRPDGARVVHVVQPEHIHLRCQDHVVEQRLYGQKVAEADNPTYTDCRVGQVEGDYMHQLETQRG
jgi:hypothetical protein